MERPVTVYKAKEPKEEIKGQIYIKNGEPVYLKDIPTVYQDESRHLYRIGHPDLKYLNKYTEFEVFYKDKQLTPLTVYSSGYFTLEDRYPRVTVNLLMYPTKLWANILEMDLRRYSISDDERVPIYIFEFEVFKAKLTENQNIDELSTVMLTIKKNMFRLWCECIKKGSIFESIESPLFIKEA